MGSSQAQVLSILAKEGPMTQKDLQQILRVQPGSLSELLSKLETKGMIERSEDADDRRRVVLSLTDEGKEAASESKMETAEEDLFAALTGEEQESLAGLLKKLLADWEK